MRHLLVLVAILLGACQVEPESSETGGDFRVDQRMGAAPHPGFARATQPRTFDFPSDHGPHDAFATEWWYFTGNLNTPDGERFGYQLTLFRVGLLPEPPATDSTWRATQIYMGHIAISDVSRRAHVSASRLARAAVGLAGARADPLKVWLGPWSIEGAGQGTFPIRLHARDTRLSIRLTLQAGDKPRVLQGDAGLSRKGAGDGDASYYYSHTRLPTSGELRIGGRAYEVSGHSWFDREWSSSALAADQAGWDWFALHLDDGRELMYYRMRGHDGQAQRFSSGIIVDENGATHRLTADDVDARPLDYWRAADGTEYPVAWRLAVPRYGIRLDVAAAFDDQEMRHTVRYWEGTVDVSGSHSGVGYLELSGYAR